MRKEVLFAVIAGALFGLLVAFGIWRANNALTPKEGPEGGNPNTQLASSPSPEPQGITIAQPENEAIFQEDTVTITGVTKPNSYLTVSGELADTAIEVGDNGAFEVKVELEAGLNEIKLYDFDNNGGKSTTNLNIVYSTEFFEENK